MVEYATMIVAVIVAIAGSSAVTAWIVGHYNKVKVRAEANGSMGNTAITMVNSIQKQLDCAREEIREQRDLIKKQDKRIHDLESTHHELQTAKEEIIKLRKIVEAQGKRIERLVVVIRRLDPTDPIIDEDVS